MKTARKAILLALCVILLVVASVMGTLAYLTDNDAVTNTFTVGKVGLSLDEADTDNDTNTNDNVEVSGGVRDKANVYHLLPGHTYDKDPIVHIDSDSEDCWVFIKVENGIASIEADSGTEANGYKKIAEQITANGWSLLTEGGNIYYQKWEQFVATEEIPEKPAGYHDLPVFAQFKIDGNSVTNTILDTYKNANINVTAYAIQADGINSAADAWTLGAWS